MAGTINIALSGLNAATQRLNASAQNIANLQTVGSLAEGERAPFAPVTNQQTTITDTNGTGQGVRTEIVERAAPFVPAFDPGSPFADENGIIGVPNIDLAGEAVNLILAELSYKANLEIIETASELDQELLNIFDDEV